MAVSLHSITIIIFWIRNILSLIINHSFGVKYFFSDYSTEFSFSCEKSASVGFDIYGDAGF